MKIAAAVLAGGRSSRMGHDKASLLWRGELLWCHQVRILQNAGFEEIWISCRGEQKATFGTEFPLVYDEPEASGPLSGIARVLERTGRTTAIVGVDMPYVTTHFWEYLVENSQEGSQSVVFQKAGYFEPLCAIYAASSLPMVQSLERQGVKRLQELWDALVSSGIAKILFPQESHQGCFENLNTLEQWRRHQQP